MLSLNLIDKNFSDQTSVCPGKTPRLVEWDRDCASAAPLVLTDWVFGNVLPGASGQFGWLLESPLSQAGQYARSKLAEAEPHLEAIFTSERGLVLANPTKYRYAPVGGIWVEDPSVRPKTREASMIASTKAATPQQVARCMIADAYADVVDVFGRGRQREIERVEDALDDYRFSVAIENAVVPGYWTEKILNCFATGTVPVYQGAPDIGRYFDERGIIVIDASDEPFDFSVEHYMKLLPYVIANFHEAMRYEIPDDRLVVDHFSDWL